MGEARGAVDCSSGDEGHLIRGLDQDVRVLGLEHEIWIELFHDVIKPAMAARALSRGSIPTE
jgi:hypothetical protein